MTFTLERIIYGTADSSDELSVLGISDHLTPQDAALWRGITSVKPLSGDSFKDTRSYGIFAGPGERFVAACAYQHAGKPFFEYIVLPREVLAQLAGNLTPLLDLFQPPDVPRAARVAPLKLANAAPWTAQKRRAQIETLLARYVDMPQALRLLAAALHERGLVIYDFPADSNARLALIFGLMALLPAYARPDVTFSTNRHEKTMTQARIVFAPATVVTGRWVANWATHSFPDDEVLALPYVRRLTALWNRDLTSFLSAIDQMDAMADAIMSNRSLQNSLTVMAERHALDAQLRAGEEVAPEALKAVMKDIPPEGELKRLYARRLLAHALDARDADAALIVAHAMDEDAPLDEELYAQLEGDLSERPDAVYSFVRTRLTSGETDGRWGERLKVAALESLRVAILDGDAETAINWLRLVAREPSSYNLGEIVHYGILSAQERAHSEPQLAQALILLAVKRDPAALETLLTDSALLAALPNGLGVALRDGEGEALTLLQAYGVEVFLVALTRALEKQRPTLFTPEAIEQVWTLYTSGAANGSLHTVEHIVNGLCAQGAAWLTTPALETLLGLTLRDKRDDLWHQIIHQVSQREDFLAIVVSALHQSMRGESDVLALIAQMIAVGDLTQQDAVNVYIGLLVTWDWRRSALEIMEQVARAIQQHSDITIELEVIWHLLAVAADSKEEFIARVALRRLTADLETVEDEEQMGDNLLRLLPLIGWSSAARTQVLVWWRGFVHEQSTARLQRLDRALADNAGETKRALEELRTIVQTVIGFRRMIGKRTLTQFAEDVGTTYAILQGLAESFDPSPRHAVSFDTPTVRLEMDARAEEVSPHELKILANNFKELAQLVASMADNRSKATLIRRGDDVDRQLMTGEQQPHSAVDVLKWLSGYLSGTQEKIDEEDA